MRNVKERSFELHCGKRWVENVPLGGQTGHVWIDELWSNVQSLRRELADHLYNEVDSHQTLVVQTLTTSAKSVVETEAEFDARLTTLQERAERLVIMYQTPLHWCVEGWASVYRKAKAGGVTSISSPLVATGRNGYRFSLVVYPFGHDSGGRSCQLPVQSCRSHIKPTANNVLPFSGLTASSTAIAVA